MGGRVSILGLNIITILNTVQYSDGHQKTASIIMYVTLLHRDCATVMTDVVERNVAEPRDRIAD